MPRKLSDMSSALNGQNLLQIASPYQGPFWVYDADIIRQQIGKLHQFDVVRFAQKACSNIHILRLMCELGVKVDAVSPGEIHRALLAGFDPQQHDIVFTADVLDEAGLALVCAHRIPVNAGSIDMLHQLAERSLTHPIWLRINPGFGHGHSQKTNTGGENSKHGIWYQQLQEAIAVSQQYAMDLQGFHIHIGSGVDYQHLAQVCDAMVDLVIRSGVDIKAISAGGGLSIPYHFDEDQIDIENYYSLWNTARQKIAEYLGHSVILELEPGRFLVAESGVLVSQVRATKTMGSRYFVLTDAGFNDLQRPAMYGSYHHASLLPTNGLAELKGRAQQETVLAGPLCESGDVFTQLEGGMVQPRMMPAAKTGDYLIFHDTGAYGATMSSNYNSRPFLPEILIDKGQSRVIRRRQTMDDLLALEL